MGHLGGSSSILSLSDSTVQTCKIASTEFRQCVKQYVIRGCLNISWLPKGEGGMITGDHTGGEEGHPMIRGDQSITGEGGNCYILSL